MNAPLREFVEEKMKEMKKGEEEREMCGFELQFVSDLHIGLFFFFSSFFFHFFFFFIFFS